jgi:hypothetical protein
LSCVSFHSVLGAGNRSCLLPTLFLLVCPFSSMLHVCRFFLSRVSILLLLV